MPQQAHRQIAVSSPLGEDVLLFRHMATEETLGRLFNYRLDFLSEERSLKFDDVLGKSMTVSLELPSGKKRYFNGFPVYFAQTGTSGNYATYHAVLRPWLWFLTRSADCRIFQQQKVPDIIKQVFRDLGFSDFEESLSGSYREWEYCVQYRETHFDFVSRLMEQEGIYYFFKHEDGKHTLVLADSYSAHDVAADYEAIPYFPPDVHQRRERDHISDLVVAKEIQTTSYALKDYDFEKPRADLQVKSSISRDHARSKHEVYDYPGEYLTTGEGDHYVRTRIEELQANYERVRGGGNARGLATGALFELTDFPREDQNREYLVVSSRYELDSDDYETMSEARRGTVVECNFEAIESKQAYRSPRSTPRPIVQGPQTAVVVGPRNQEIYTNKYGQVKVQFHWDRYGKSDEKSSCWIRVAQAWAGKQWGAVHIPRIGQEVIVEFLEGDPDQPIITGRVYNSEQMPPYALSAHQTQSGIKSRSTSKGSADNFNELRFEDRKGEEEVYFHAEKDFKRIVENDDILEVGYEKKDPGDQKVKIYQNRTTTVEKGNDKIEIKTGNRDLIVSKGDRTVKINAGKSFTQAARSITLKVGGSTVKLEPAKISLKIGGSSITLDPASIAIKAPMVKVAGNAMVEVKAPMTTVKGMGLLILKGGLVMIN